LREKEKERKGRKGKKRDRYLFDKYNSNLYKNQK
jgi:hypothetical protein